MWKTWIAAARPRTLLVSVSPVIVASAYAWHFGAFRAVPATICLVFAVLAQVASNLANDYFDYRKGTDDAATRIGPRRAVASGDISPKAMLTATLSVLASACVVGCLLIGYGGWELLIAGVWIAVFALAYSAGPYPLSYHGLGDVTVFVFFGLAAVNLTYYVQASTFDSQVFLGSVAMGLLAINVLLLNNYRDCDVDAAGGKRTSVVILGRKFARRFYLLNGFAAVGCCYAVWGLYWPVGSLLAVLYLALHVRTWRDMSVLTGPELNPLLGRTARNQFLFSLFIVLLLVFA